MLEPYFESVFRIHQIEDGNAVRLLRWRQAEIIEKAKESDEKIRKLEDEIFNLRNFPEKAINDPALK